MTNFFPHNVDTDAACNLGGSVLDRDLGLSAGSGNVTASTSSASPVNLMAFDIVHSNMHTAPWTYNLNFSLVSGNAAFTFQLQALDASCNVVASSASIVGAPSVNAGSFGSLTWDPNVARRLRLRVVGNSTDGSPANVRLTCGATSYITGAIDSRRHRIIDQVLARLATIGGVGTIGRILQAPWQVKESGGLFPAYLVWGAEEEKGSRTGGSTGGSKSVTLKVGIRVLTIEDSSGNSGQVLVDNAMRDAENAIETLDWRNIGFPIFSAVISTVGVASYSDAEGQGWGIGDMVLTVGYNQAYGAQ